MSSLYSPIDYISAFSVKANTSLGLFLSWLMLVRQEDNEREVVREEIVPGQ